MKRNAIIMAAGTSSRFVPLSFEKPKGLLNVKEEILIERQIKQLKETNIDEIIIVVGYKKEQYFYLKDKYNVKIVINDDYDKYNNTSSLIKVLNEIDNTFICSCDNYFTENVFKDIEEESYYSVIYENGKTNEYCVFFNENEVINRVEIGGKDSYIMLGHVYFNSKFSKKFKEILKKEYSESERCKKELWEQLYMRHICELPLKIKKYKKDVIYEFDSLDELREFDKNYKSDSKILKEIQTYLKCEENELSGFKLLKNEKDIYSFSFMYNDRIFEYSLDNIKKSWSVKEVE